MALVPDPTQPVSLPRTPGHEDSEGNSSWSASPSPSPSLTAPAPRAGAAAVEITIEEAAGDAAAGGAERGRCPRAAPFSSSSPVSRRQPSATTRRDPRRAELFRSLAASSFARRLDPPSPPIQPPLPPPQAEDPDLPLWPPNTAAWRLFRYTLGSPPPSNSCCCLMIRGVSIMCLGSIPLARNVLLMHWISLLSV